MINVKSELMYVPSGTVPLSDMVNQLKKEVWNNAAKEFALSVQKEVRNAKCEDHPSSNPVVIIKAEVDGIQVIKRSFCCKKFEDQIQITVKK